MGNFDNRNGIKQLYRCQSPRIIGSGKGVSVWNLANSSEGLEYGEIPIWVDCKGEYYQTSLACLTSMMKINNKQFASGFSIEFLNKFAGHSWAM